MKAGACCSRGWGGGGEGGGGKMKAGAYCSRGWGGGGGERERGEKTNKQKRRENL